MTEKKEYPVLETKWGAASFDKSNGYYRISSRNEYRGKLLHRLIFEDYHDCKLDKTDVIHHIDNDSTNNHPTNLICMSREAHNILHKRNKIVSWENRKKNSISKNSSGFLNVYKNKNPRYKQGFQYIYRYSINGERKPISSVDLDRL